EEQSDHREYPEEPGDQLLLGVFVLAADPAFEVASKLDHLLVRIDLNDLSAEIVKQGFGWNLGTHEDLREHPHAQGVGNIDAGLDGVAQAIVAGVGDDADNL